MLHQTFEGVEDEDLRRAIDDAMEPVAELAQVSKRLTALKPNQPAYRMDKDYASELTSRVRLIADRIDMSTNALLQLTSAELSRRARRGRGEPAKPTSRTLNDALSTAIGREADAEAVYRQAAVTLRQARRDRRGAEEAAFAYAAKGRR